MLTDAIMCSRSTSVSSPPTGIQQAFHTQICSDWTRLAGAGRFKIAPTSLLLTVVSWLFFQAFSNSVRPSRLGIDSCQTAYKKMFVRFDIKRTSPTPCFLNSVLSPSLDLGIKFKALFPKTLVIMASKQNML